MKNGSKFRVMALAANPSNRLWKSIFSVLHSSIQAISRRRAFMGAAAFSVLLFSGLPAVAGSITYTLEGVTFTDGGTASGTFTVDSLTDDLLSYDITTTAGSVLSGYEYDQADSSGVSNSVLVYVSANSIHLYLNLVFASSLSAGGTISLVNSESYECTNCGYYRFTSGGEATTSVPEPASLIIFCTGLTGLAGLRSRRPI